jgi:hypothetical protein
MAAIFLKNYKTKRKWLAVLCSIIMVVTRLRMDLAITETIILGG